MRLGGWLLAFTGLSAGGRIAISDSAPGAKDQLPRFHQEAPGILRGGQPRSGGFALLKQRGVRTIVNLRREHDQRKQPVFVHCRRGADRTGFMVGLYRIEKEGWSAEKAYQKARELGLRWWYRGMKRQISEFAAKVHSGGHADIGK